MPSPLTKSFSARRSCATANDLAPGKTGAARRRPLQASAAGTFSNSQVTTSTAAAKRATASCVGVAADGLGRRDIEGRRVGLVGIDMRLEAEPARRPWPACGRAGRRPECRWCCRAAAGAQALSSSASATAVGLRRAIGGDAGGEAGIVQGQDLRRQQSGIGGAGLADGRACRPARRPASGRWRAGCRGL